MWRSLAGIVLYLTSFSINASKLVLHFQSGKEPITLTGDDCDTGALFSKYNQFSCACVTGLWAFYTDNCEKAHVLVAGLDDQCFPIDFRIRKVNLLSPSVQNASFSSAAVFDPSVKSLGGKFISVDGSSGAPNFVPAGFPIVITSGNQSQTWRLPSQRRCMKPTESDSTQFCIFNHNTVEEYRIENGCQDGDDTIVPQACVAYMQDKDMEQKDPKSCNMEKGQLSRVRRNIREMGRVFLDAVLGLPGNDTNSSVDTGNLNPNLTSADENIEVNITITNPILNSELWNYMTLRAQILLDLRQPRKMTMDSPAFVFLDIAKRILQRVCPDHYVRDEHFDVCVGSFISMQKNHMKFTDQFVDFATTQRIEDALNACFANLTEPYPFPERQGDPNITCNGSQPVLHGTIEKFNKTIEFSLGEDASARNSEPIIETVWKVFTHAHSACFPHFKNSFNDHHRFTTIMLPLFTNDVNEIWKNSVQDGLKPDIYSGFLGNAVELMDSVDYCSLFSRLESNYPWDLPRPNKDNARRKREIKDDKNYQCLENQDSQNLCPLQEIWTADEDYPFSF